jgi:lysine-N-methylase
VRPRLHDDVIARRHLADGRDLVVLHDERSQRVMKILPVQWEVIALADGTRDVEGIVLAARARGVTIEESDLTEFIGYLAREGVLDEGPLANVEPDPHPDADLAEVPLDPIDGWRFTCSGRGTCCEVFPTILFTPVEAARALVVLPNETHEFFPERGEPREGKLLAPILNGGRCRYFIDRKCTIHAAGGAKAKPEGCSAFPMQLVYDGEVVRAATAYECACVADGVGATDGEGPIPEGARLFGDLHRVRVGRVPEEVWLDAEQSATRDEVRAFYRELARAPAPDDVAMGFWSLASAIEAAGLDPKIVRAFGSTAFVEEALPWLEELASCISQWREPLAAYRAEDDLTRCAFGWMLDAAARIGEDPSWRTPERGSRAAIQEAFYARTTSWLCRDAIGALPLTTALRVRAIRVWLSRALDVDDFRAAEPLALVEVMFRAHGLDAFAL